MKRILFLLIGILISAVSLYFAFKGFDLGAVWDATTRVRPLFFALMIIPYIFTFMSKVWRWKVLFHPDEARAKTGTLFASLMISYIPLPFRAGEVARGVVASAKAGIPVARVFSTIFVEKILDVLALLVFLGISLPFVELPANLQGTALLLGALVVVAAIVIIALVLKPDLARRLVGVVSGRLPARLGPRIQQIADQVLEGLAPLSQPSIALRLGLWSLVTWGVNSLTVYLMMLAFNVDVTPMAAVVLVVISNLSMTVPSAPGYIGPFELAVVGVLKVLGVAESTAQSFAIIYHFVGLVPVALMGVIAAVQQGVGLAAFRQAPPEAETRVTTPVPPTHGPVAAQVAAPAGRDERRPQG